jgi:hypothetical protein
VVVKESPANIISMLITLATLHVEISLLKAVAETAPPLEDGPAANISFIVVTLDTSQNEIFPSKALAPLNAEKQRGYYCCAWDGLGGG